MKITHFGWALCLVAAVAGAGDSPQHTVAGRIVEGLACASDRSQTYSLLLPPGYHAERKWPVLLVFDPRGRSVLAAELFRGGAERHGWIIVSSNDTRSDDGVEPNRRAVNALWREIHERYPVDTERIYAAGFSGTVSVAFLVGKETGGLAGVVAVGGRDVPEAIDQTQYAVWGAVGDTDYNNLEMRVVHDRLTRQGNPNRLEIFEGGHSWMPPALGAQAVEWFELMAMRRGSKPRDAELIRSALHSDIERAAMLASEGRLLMAERLYTSIATDYDGLADVSLARTCAAELASNPEVKRRRKLEQRWDGYERRYRIRMERVFQLFLDNRRAEPPDRLVKELAIDELRRRADRDGTEGLTARRLLAVVYTTTSFYMTRDLLRQGRPNHAASVLGVACSIRDDDPVVWYNRACALSLAGRPSDALAALTRAVEVGFGDLELMRIDADLEALRGTDEFVSLLKKLEASVPEE